MCNAPRLFMLTVEQGGAVLLYKFRPAPFGGQRVGLTPDQSGSNLPPDGAPWEPIGSVDISVGPDESVVGGSPAEIIAGINRDGYFVWPIESPMRGRT